MNFSQWNNKFYVIWKSNKLIKTSVPNLAHLVVGGIVIKFYLSAYILALVEILPWTEKAELPEFPDWENLEYTSNYEGSLQPPWYSTFVKS